MSDFINSIFSILYCAGSQVLLIQTFIICFKSEAQGSPQGLLNQITQHNFVVCLLVLRWVDEATTPSIHSS